MKTRLVYIFSLVFLTLTFASRAHAKLNVVATIPDIGALVEAVGGSDISVDTIAKGTQDPHFLEPKPSYMVKVSHADLVVANGLALEIGWLPSLISGGRNPKVNPGAKGYLELGPDADPIDVIKGTVSRAGGDVHPDGNPHFTIDPIRLGKLALVVAAKLGELDGSHSEAYITRAKSFQKQMEDKTKLWQERIKKSGITKTVTYHNDMAYFLNRFNITAVGYLEPKPGIPPTASHLIEMTDLIKAQKVPLILVENFFDTKIADRLVSDLPNVKIKVIGIAVGSKPELKTNFDVIEQIVSAIESR